MTVLDQNTLSSCPPPPPLSDSETERMHQPPISLKIQTPHLKRIAPSLGLLDSKKAMRSATASPDSMVSTGKCNFDKHVTKLECPWAFSIAGSVIVLTLCCFSSLLLSVSLSLCVCVCMREVRLNHGLAYHPILSFPSFCQTTKKPSHIFSYARVMVSIVFCEYYHR